MSLLSSVIRKAAPAMALVALCASLLVGCAPKNGEAEVYARAVPERGDDFAWENDYVFYRAYGASLETSLDFLTSPGFDVWVKNPGPIMMDKLYKDELENGLSYHNYRGLGKDCYKVSKSLGAGASSVVIADTLRFPATNWRAYEILEQEPRKVVFVLKYPKWDVCGYTISLDKKITVEAGTHFCKAEDVYTFTGPTQELPVAAGIIRHDIRSEFKGDDRFAIWERASDQSKEPEDGMIGLGLVMPGAKAQAIIQDHSVLMKNVRSGETLTYYFGNCWSKADVKTDKDWFDMVKAVK